MRACDLEVRPADSECPLSTHCVGYEGQLSPSSSLTQAATAPFLPPHTDCPR